jgi:hypothetical protein
MLLFKGTVEHYNSQFQINLDISEQNYVTVFLFLVLLLFMKASVKIFIE